MKLLYSLKLNDYNKIHLLVIRPINRKLTKYNVELSKHSNYKY